MTILKARPYQVEANQAVKAAWDEGLLRPAVVLPTGAGKAQPVDEPVLTPGGWSKMGELRVGDYVVGSDGRPTRVTGVFPQGARPVVRMEFNDGSWVRCDEEHLWSVRTRDDKHEGKPFRTLKASEIRDRIGTGWYVPFVDPVQYDEKNLPMDPYLLGSLLGDGGISGETVYFTGMSDSVREVSKVLPEGVRLVRDRHSNAGDAESFRLSSAIGAGKNPVKESLRLLGLAGTNSHTKFIPRSYLESSVNQRVSLLQGLVDTDGYVSGTYVEYSSVSRDLAEGVRELVQSLGGWCRLRSKKTSWNHNGVRKTGSVFRVTFGLPESITPARLPRKVNSIRIRKNQFTRKIVSVVPDGFDDCVCISVDAPDRLYVTRNHVLTHNTVTFAHLIADLGVRTFILVHRDELAKQAADKLRSVAPDLDIGIVKAEMNQVESDVVVASIQTLYREKRLQQLLDAGKPGLVVYDECHHAVAPANMSVLEQLGVFEDVRCVGYTATMSRADSYGLGDVWQDVVYKKDILWGIINGFLVDVVAETVQVDGFNLAEIAKKRGDYQEGKLGDALVASGAGKVVAEKYKERCGDKQGIVFTPTVACAEDFLDHFNKTGIPSALVVGTTPVEERQQIYKQYEEGKVRVLVSVMALTEGFDMPQAEVAVIARPTMSQSLYIQMVGRVLRLFPGKLKALVLDVVGAEAASLSGIVDLSETKVAPIKGESLAEAYEREQDEQNNLKRDVVSGKVTSKVVNLFKQSSSVWLKTPGGYWFIPTREGYVFLWPHGDGFKVGITGSQYKMKGGRYLKDEPLELHFAMAWGEQLAEEIDPSTSQRSASWRRKKERANPKQRELADRLGIVYSEDIRKDAMSDKIATHFASKILDTVKRK